MRRFLVLLLAFVLPLQMSWAAAHACDGERLVPQAVEAQAQAHASHDAAADQAEKIAEACCEAAHGCNGLHHVMGHAQADLIATGAGVRPAPAAASPPLAEVPQRIDRPNWRAA